MLNQLHDCIRHQHAIAQGSSVIHQDNSFRLHLEAPLEETNGSADDISLLSSTSSRRGARVSDTAQQRAEVICICCEPAPWGAQNRCTCAADLPASVRWDVYAQVMWWGACLVVRLHCVCFVMDRAERKDSFSCVLRTSDRICHLLQE